MRYTTLACALLLAGCGLDLADGALLCSHNGKACPDGYACAGDDRCYRTGHSPDLAGGTALADGGGEMSPLEAGVDFATAGSPDLLHAKQQGDPCQPGDLCQNSQCVDGFCCNSACTDPCQACDISGSLGACNNVTGPPHGTRACNGTGTCGGICDGTASTCHYADSSTICGASCNGNCDGNGTCSASGGTSCPNGFACGPSSCLTACAHDNDCAAFFTCAAPPSCVRVPESDCLDGIDNNGDGLADCMDPTCNAKVACVPSNPGGGAQLGVLAASCPMGFGAGSTVYNGFHATSCGGCTCTTHPTCSTTVVMDTTDCTSGSPQSYTVTGLPGATTCKTITFNGNTGLVLDHYDPGTISASKTCTVGGAPARTSYSFDGNTNFCPVPKTSDTCGSMMACAAKAPSTMCVQLPGAVGCPMGYMTTGPTPYYTGASDGTCGSCPGSCGAGSPGCSASANVYVSWTSCSGAHNKDAGPGGVGVCTAVTNDIYSAALVDFVSNGAAEDCNISQPSVTGGGATGQTTICCQ